MKVIILDPRSQSWYRYVKMKTNRYQDIIYQISRGGHDLKIIESDERLLIRQIVQSDAIIQFVAKKTTHESSWSLIIQSYHTNRPISIRLNENCT